MEEISFDVQFANEDIRKRIGPRRVPLVNQSTTQSSPSNQASTAEQVRLGPWPFEMFSYKWNEWPLDGFQQAREDLLLEYHEGRITRSEYIARNATLAWADARANRFKLLNSCMSDVLRLLCGMRGNSWHFVAASKSMEEGLRAVDELASLLEDEPSGWWSSAVVLGDGVTERRGDEQADLKTIATSSGVVGHGND